MADTPKAPDCFESAMNFLGGPEEKEVRAYVTALQAELERALIDARRYDWIRKGTEGHRDARGRKEFVLPDPHPLGNIMQGSVAQHLDAAIDAAIRSGGGD